MMKKYQQAFNFTAVLSLVALLLAGTALPLAADGLQRVIKTTIITDTANEYPLDLADAGSSQATRDKIRAEISEKTARSLAHFVKDFDPETVKKGLRQHTEVQSAIPMDVIRFIGTTDQIEIDDDFGKEGENTDKAKKLFLFKTLLEFAQPKSNSASRAAGDGGNASLLSAEEKQEYAKLRVEEMKNAPVYKFEVDQSAIIEEDPNDYVENMKYLKEIAAKGGLPNSVTSQKWIDGQADCVDDNGNAKPGVWIHTHADGTIRDFPQDSYKVPPLRSGLELACTELDALTPKTPLNQYRDLVSHAEQKVLYVDYEHYPEGMEPTPNDIDVNKVGAPGEQVVTDSDHPYGNTKDGTGNWDKKIIRAVYWRDIAVPILCIDERDGEKCTVADLMLYWEKMVDAYDTPPDRLVYMIPPLLEPPLPPTTFTRNQFPLKPTYGGR